MLRSDCSGRACPRRTDDDEVAHFSLMHNSCGYYVCIKFGEALNDTMAAITLWINNP